MTYTRVFLLLPAMIFAGSYGNPNAALSEATQRQSVNEQAGQEAGREAAGAIVADVEAWALERDLLLRQRRGLPITKLPDTSLAGTKATAEYARAILERIERVDVSAIDHQSLVNLQVIQNTFEKLASAPEYYWLQFSITPYARMFALYPVNPVLAGIPLETAEQRRIYLGLVDGYARIVQEWATKTDAQEKRGILIPKAALPGVRVTLIGEKGAAAALLLPQSSRLKGVDAAVADDFLAAVAARIKDRVEPAYDAILAVLDEDYEKRAPDTVGMNQYPGGAAAYRVAVRQATSYDVSPEELHASGLAALESLHAKMKAIRDELGFEGSAMQFNERLRTDPRFIAKSAAEVESRFTDFLRQIKSLIDDYFQLTPEAPYGVMRLDPAQEAGHTFGYYQMPSATEPRGLYRYNGSQLAERSMVSAQSLIYHELIPGHHFQIALQAQMKELPLIMQSFDFIMLTAYTEGWAEYASSLGMEMGLYDDPYERYDRYLKEAYLATRLVVDTGMNLFGWSLEKARCFMRVNTSRSETEIASETLRYSTDIPAQALGYRYGADFIWRLRREKAAELGDAFDVKDFHAAVLGAGVLPMSVLENHVQWYFDHAVAAERAP